MIRNYVPWTTPNKTMRKKILTVGIAAISLLLTPSGAFAGAKEIEAIQAKLPAGVTIATATSSQLSAAVVAAIKDTANAKLNKGTIAGEALKGAGAPAGSAFGADLAAAILADTAAVTAIGDQSKFTASSAITATTKKLANAANVPGFAAAFVADNAGAIATAKLAIKSKTAAGAILGGRGSEIADADLDDLANAALADSKLKAAAQAISQYVVDQADDDVAATTTATNVAAANPNLLKKIAPGAVAGAPEAASEIVDQLLTNSTTQPFAVKAVSSLAKSISRVADTEEVQLIGVEFAERMVAATPLIKLSKLNSIAKALVSGIIKNPNPTATVGLDNQKDEIGEVAAYMLNAVSTATVFDDPKKGPKTVISFIKTLVKAAKKKGDKPAVFQKAAAQDIAGSVVETLQSLGTAVVADILTKLQDPKTAKKIGGTKLAPSVALGITEAIGTSFPNKYENGTDANLGTVNEPTTDNRNS
jgi:hypothetical protein